jgi:hypothetical protein
MTGILDCTGAVTDGLQLNLSTLLMFYGKMNVSVLLR